MNKSNVCAKLKSLGVKAPTAHSRETLALSAPTQLANGLLGWEIKR
jgi:hypothetical protein